MGAVAATVFASAMVGACAVGGPPASVGPSVAPAPLILTVLPPEEPVQPRTAIAGQRCIFLVRVTGGPADRPIEVTAEASGATIEVAPSEIRDDTVAEVTVVPGPVSVDATLSVTISARRGDVSATEARTIPLWPVSDTLAAEAAGRLGTFTSWLAAARPELGITPETDWQGSALQTQMLVVSHYQFLSADWEAALEWHVMIAPHDWSRLILRRRWTEDRPSVAFEIPSVSAGDPPREVEAPDAILR